MAEQIDLFKRVNKIRGGALKWAQEEKDTLRKIILTDQRTGYRKALYISKKGRSVHEGLNDLVRSYCAHYNLSY